MKAHDHGAKLDRGIEISETWLFFVVKESLLTLTFTRISPLFTFGTGAFSSKKRASAGPFPFSISILN